VQTRSSQTELTIRISKPLLDSFLEMAKAKMMAPDACASEVIEAEIIQFRSLRIRPTSPLVSGKSVRIPKNPPRYVVLSLEQIADAARLIDEEDLTIAQVAKRFGKSPTRMGDLLRKNGFVPHVQIPGPRRRKRGQPISFGAAQRPV
jgi:predicted DNA-binding protein (UPF0251 family)